MALFCNYKTLTPIQGTPTYETIKRFDGELQANANSVATDLGEGDYGNVGLVLSDKEYQGIKLTTRKFDAQLFSWPLIIQESASEVTALTLNEQYHEAKRVYYEFKNVEKALLRHIQDSMEDCCLETMVNEDTSFLSKDIPTALQYLFDNYDRVSTVEVKGGKSESLGNDLPSRGSYGHGFQSYSKDQEIGCINQDPLYIITNSGLWIEFIQNTGAFERALGEWAIKPPGFAKRWIAFQDHLQRAQKSFQEIRGPTMQPAAYQVVNILAAQLQLDIQSENL